MQTRAIPSADLNPRARAASPASTVVAVPPRIHVALNVTDLPAAVAFYRAMLAAEPVRDLPDFAKFVVGDPPINLALSAATAVVPGASRAGAPEPAGVLSHLGFQVASAQEVAAYGARWDAAGLPTRSGLSVAEHDKVWVYDPDGNEWEVFAE